MLIQLLKSIFNLVCGSPATSTTPPEKPQQIRQDANQINQSNEYYVSLRAQANEHGDQMAKCFQESHDAYSGGNGALAKELSNQGKEHQRKMEDLNKQASDIIFVENNKDSKPGEVDLHGLYVKEAISRADQAIQKAKSEGQPRSISLQRSPLSWRRCKIKPAIEELIQKYQLTTQLDPDNSGVLIVLLQSRPGERGMGATEISRRLERDEESCTIM
ncbi:hypothetical protein BDZ97DRAFT_677668 [Flammula alnicola]|nr:hypothetical protein BDZ97DRAFT_677668 [Flammula alnicola]